MAKLQLAPVTAESRVNAFTSVFAVLVNWFDPITACVAAMVLALILTM